MRPRRESGAGVAIRLGTSAGSSNGEGSFANAARRLYFFHAGSDHIDLIGGADHSFADLVANGHISQVGVDVVITDGAGTSLTLTGVDLGALTSSDFLFG